MKDSPSKLIEEFQLSRSSMVRKRTLIDTLTQSRTDKCNILCYFRDYKTYSRKLRFAEDERQTNFKKEESKFTDFDEEIKTLRTTITKNSNDEEVDSIYKKLEELI